MDRIYHAGGPDMGYAKGTFDPKKFAASSLGKSVEKMKAAFYTHEFEPEHPEVLAHWQRLGVRQEIFDAGTPPEQEKMFSVLCPVQLEKGKQYPLVYCLHGGGETAFGAEFYGYGEIIGAGGCIGVFPTASCHGNERVEREFERILAFLKDKKYPIDFTRVYVIGFSGGEGATQRLGMLHADKIAAIAPTPGPNSFRGDSLQELQATYNERLGLVIPMICLGGSEDGGDSWPLNTEQCVEAFNFYMSSALRLPGFTPLTLAGTYNTATQSQNTVSRLFGMEFDETWIQNFSGTYVYFGEYYSDKGYATARFGSIIGLPHVQCPLQARLIWQYLEPFSRDLVSGESLFTARGRNGATR